MALEMLLGIPPHARYHLTDPVEAAIYDAGLERAYDLRQQERRADAQLIAEELAKRMR